MRANNLGETKKLKKGKGKRSKRDQEDEDGNRGQLAVGGPSTGFVYII